MSERAVHLLGPVRVGWDGGEPPRFRSQRTMALLGYLAAERRPVARDALATLLWPDVGLSKAKANLRRELHNLGKVLPGCWQTDRQTVRFTPGEDVRVDVYEVLGLEEAERWAEAADLVRGDFLEGVSLDDNLEFETWLFGERERWRQRVQRILSEAIVEEEQSGDHDEALRFARRLLQLMPWHEQTHGQVMILLARQGRRGAALRQYKRCKATMLEELGVDVSAETQVLYEQIRDAPARRPALHRDTMPLVGRRRAWAQLQGAWHMANQHGPHFALLSGEAGIGKTRLAEELLAWAESEEIAATATRSFAVEGQLAYAPVIGWLRTRLIQRAISYLEEVWLTELARLLPELLVERPALPQPEPLAESWQRQRLFEAIARAVLAAGQPLLLFVDDLHWSDDQTLDWLHYLLRFDPQAKLLVVGAMRPEEVVEDHRLLPLFTALRGSGQLTDVDLVRLNEAETAALAGHVTGRELETSEKATLYRETEGNPLFIVEALRADLAEVQSPSFHLQRSAFARSMRADDALPSLSPKVQAVIERRLNQLSAGAREVAEVGAVIGREFSFDVVARASDQDEGAVVEALDELWQRRIVRERDDVYDFSHDKIREVAAGRLSPARRRFTHNRVAQAMEAVSARPVAELAADLARHYTAAGETEKAVAYRLAAGKRALALSAHHEAIRHLQQGLVLLETLPKTTDRDQTELSFRLALSSVLVPQKGYTAPEVREVYDQAAALAGQLGEESRLVPVLYGLGQYYTLRGEWRTARTLAERCLHLAQQSQYPGDLMLAHGLLGFTLSYMGDPARALEHLKRSLMQYEQRPASPAAGTDLGVLCRCHVALTLWALGYPEQSLAEMDGALKLARDLSHPYSLAAALTHAGGLSMLRQEPQRTHVYQEKASALCTKHEFPYWQAYSRMLQGWALAKQGSVTKGLAEAQRGQKTFTALGANTVPYTYPLLAQIYASAGDVAEGLRVVDGAVAGAANTGLRCLESMALRIKGDLLWLGGAAPDEIEACYQQAIDIARNQGARSFELQATINLCRLWQQQRRQAEARRLLTGIYGRFSEGFDTPDLKAAGALLELSA